MTAVSPARTTDGVSGPLLSPTGAVTHAELTTALGLLANSLRSQFFTIAASGPSPSGGSLDTSSLVSRDLFTKQIDSLFDSVAKSQRIDQLSNVTITDATHRSRRPPPQAR